MPAASQLVAAAPRQLERLKKIEFLPEYPNKRNPEKPGRSKFEYRLLEETGLRAFAMLGSNI